MTAYSPWRHVRHLPDVIVGFRDDLPDGRGWWSPRHRVILLARGMTQVARRSVLAHELAHIDLAHSGVDDGPDADRLDMRIEQAADDLAARRLITTERLIDALLWSMSEEELADELWVEVDVVRTRLRHLTDAEKEYIDGRLRSAERGIA